MAMFAMPTGGTERLGSDKYEFSTIGPPSFPGAVSFPIQDKKTKVEIKWPTIDPKKGSVLPPINSTKEIDVDNAPQPKDFPILSLTVTNLEKPKKKEEDNSDAKFAEDLPAIMIKQLKAMKPTGSLQFIPDHERSSTAYFTESHWDSDSDHDDVATVNVNINNNNNIHQNPLHQQHRQHQQMNHDVDNSNREKPQEMNTEFRSNGNVSKKKKNKSRTRIRSQESDSSDASIQSMHTRQDEEHVEFQHDINDILSLSIKDKYIYMVLDHCISTILDVWNASQIATKTATDIEAELLLNASGLYETLLDYFFNSPSAICSAIHQICCKIHVQRLLMDGTKMIHIPSNLEEFEKTFGDLTSIKISTILGKKRRKFKKKKSIQRVRIQSVTKDERKKRIAQKRTGTNDASHASLACPDSPELYKQESMEAKQDRVELPPAGTPVIRRLKTLEKKIQTMNSVTSLAAARYNERTQTREALAKRLRSALKELIFQHRKTYFGFWESKQFEAKKAFSFDEKQKLNVTQTKIGTPISRQMTKILTKIPTNKKGMDKNIHPTVRCEGCGQMMDMNDETLQNTVIAYEVPCTNTTFFFHDEICVNLRKYKEIIRKYVSESKLPSNKKSKNLPQYIKNLMQNFNSLIGIHGHETLSRPYNPFQKRSDLSKHSLNKALSSNKSYKSIKLPNKHSRKPMVFEDEEEEESNYDDSDIDTFDVELTAEEMAHLSLIQREREIACIALSRVANNNNVNDKKYEFDDIPLSIQICDINIYGIVLWEFVMQQLLTKQMHSLWLLLAYLSSELSTKRAIDLLDEHLADIAKVKNVENLELVCAAILRNASYPIATALHLSHFISSVADNDLSRKDEFQIIADRYTNVAEKLVECVESDHLLSLFLEAPTNFNMNSIFEIAIDYEMEDFFDNNRVGRIMDHMWSTFDFLNPSLNYRTRDIDLYEILSYLCFHPAQFYYSPVGRYWIKSLLYIVYVILITIVAGEQSYLHKKVTSLESIMWIYNIGYILFEIMEMTFRGIEYFSDYSNYFDIFIILNWTILGVMRFFLYSADHSNDDSEHLDHRNSSATLTYMVVFGIQICVLYCRICTIFVRTKNLGPFIRMIGDMLDDVFNFAFVSLIFFLGFAVAIHYIIGGDISEECGGEADINSPYTTSLFVFITLMGQLEWSVLHSNECFEQPRAVIAQLFIVVFSILGTMLLVNLLIAMMATTYNEKLDAKAKEVNYYRTEEVYQLAHEQAIISPPLNMLVFASVIVWYLFEFIVYLVSGGKYCINIALITPVHIDYSASDANDIDQRKKRHKRSGRKLTYVQPKCGGLLVKYPSETGAHFSKRFCQYCKIYMEENGNISDYLALFKGYRLDKDDVKVIKNMFANQGLCPKCYRPYKLYPDGKSNRLARWQVIIEILSFYAFMLIYVPMLLILTIPALFVGFWNFLQDLASSNVESRMIGHGQSNNYDSHVKKTQVNRNYKQLIRSVLHKETTSEIDRLHEKIDKIAQIMDGNGAQNPSAMPMNMGNNDESMQFISKQYNQLSMMVASINSRVDLLTASLNAQQQPQRQRQQQQQPQRQRQPTNYHQNTNNNNKLSPKKALLKPAGKLEALSTLNFSGY